MKKKFAIVGCGRIAQRHAGHIANYGELVAVCDNVEAKADDLASLVKHMIQSDVKLMQKEQYLKAGGYHSSKNLE